MNVLLLEDVKGVGRRMEVKSVSDGYARNFLFARKLAVPADEVALRTKEEYTRDEETTRARYHNAVKKLASEPVTFKLATGPNGEVFGSVTQAAIEAKILEAGIQEAKIELKKPIRAIGLHEVEVRFPLGIRGVVRISVAGSH